MERAVNLYGDRCSFAFHSGTFATVINLRVIFINSFVSLIAPFASLELMGLTFSVRLSWNFHRCAYPSVFLFNLLQPELVETKGKCWMHEILQGQFSCSNDVLVPYMTAYLTEECCFHVTLKGRVELIGVACVACRLAEQPSACSADTLQHNPTLDLLLPKSHRVLGATVTLETLNGARCTSTETRGMPMGTNVSKHGKHSGLQEVWKFAFLCNSQRFIAFLQSLGIPMNHG